MLGPQLAHLIRIAFGIFYLLLFARVMLSWLNLPPYHPIPRRYGPFLHAVTEPLLRPIRRALQRYQYASRIDFSPLVLYLLLLVAENLILRVVCVY